MKIKIPFTGGRALLEIQRSRHYHLVFIIGFIRKYKNRLVKPKDDAQLKLPLDIGGGNG
jgi:hypothetical protein